MQIDALVFYNGNCEEAFEFYKAALGGKLLIHRYEGTPMGEGMSDEAKQKVSHASLRAGGATLMGADSMPGHERPADSNISLCLSMKKERKADAAFAKLSAGGTVTTPMEKQFWGAKFGAFTDKFGVDWMVNCELS